MIFRNNWVGLDFRIESAPMPEEKKQEKRGTQEAPNLVATAQEIRQRAKEFLRFCSAWAYPNYPRETTLTEAQRRRQHDEISKTIWNVTWLLIASCLFCLVTLGGPDASLVNRDAKITIPFTDTTVPYSGFLFFGPIVLIGLATFLHVFLEQRLRIGRPKESSPSPYLFNLGSLSANLLSAFVFYCMLPCVLIFFCWRALPRPEVPLLILLTTVVTICMVGLGIRRFGAVGTMTSRQRRLVGGLWLFLAVCIVVLLPAAAYLATGFVLGIQTNRQPGGTNEASAMCSSYILHLNRPLQLFGAPLANANLSGLCFASAQMRKVNLTQADLEEADLSDADLREADMTKANLTRANLTGADLRGAVLTDATLRMADLHRTRVDNFTIIDAKWKRVLCLVNHDDNPDCSEAPKLPWTDLADANLRGSVLPGADMTGVDLQDSDLSHADLRGAKLWLADLRNAKLPASAYQAFIDGALIGGATPMTKPPPKTVEMILVSRVTETCLKSSDPPNNSNSSEFRPVFTASGPCDVKKLEPGETWKVQRYEQGYLQFTSVTQKGKGCLDSTPNKHDQQDVQTWDCKPDYDTQQWRITATEGFGQISIDDGQTAEGTTRFCLSSGFAHGEKVHLWTCNPYSHDENWKMIPINSQG